MNSTALAWHSAPPIRTLDPETLIAPFDERVLEGGFLRVGQRTLKRSRELGITPTEDMIRLKIEAHRFTKEQLPYLSISTIAGLIGKSYSMTQRYIKRLRQKGFLRVFTKDWDAVDELPSGLSCYYYDFSPFYALLQELEQGEPPENAEERAYRARVAEARHKQRILQEQAEQRAQQVEDCKGRNRLRLLEAQRRILLAEQRAQIAQLEARTATARVATLEIQASSSSSFHTSHFPEESKDQNSSYIALLQNEMESKVPGIEEDRSSRVSNESDSILRGGTAANPEKEEVDAQSPACSHIAHEAIRNAQQELPSSPQLRLVPTSRTSKSQTSQETGGAAPAKAARKRNTGGGLTKWQEMALASGVSLEQQDALETYMQTCPRPTQSPRLVEIRIDPLSRSYKNANVLLSNRTQATKLWQYARSRGMSHEAVEDAFREWVATASSLVPPQTEKKMAWFFKALRLEVLKALLPYEDAAPVVEEDQPAATTEELHQEEPETTTQEAQHRTNQEQQHTSPMSIEEQVQTHRVTRMHRTREQKEARASYASQVRDQLRQHGVPGALEMVVDTEHSCGCPLKHGDWSCVRCHPKREWEQDVLVYLDSLVEQ